jgi:undecaprenyl-diphosphatase
MHLLQVVLLGLVQGLTEFLPVSSTAHLTLAENLLLGHSMPLAFDMLLHAGTLVALVVYFRKELGRVLAGCIGRDEEGGKLALMLFLAMIPTGVLGLATRGTKEIAKNHLWVFGLCLWFTAAILFLANHLAKTRPGRDVGQVTWKDAFWVGGIQGIGGGFGLSRSGSTIAMGVFSGLALPASARFSFLLGIPTILAASIVEGGKLLKPLLLRRPVPVDAMIPAGGLHPITACAIGVAVSAVSGYAAIGLLDRFTRSPKLNGFAIYCLAAGLFMVVLGLRGA